MPVDFKLPLQDYLEVLHARFAPLRDGTVASYIPELAKADPDAFGICIATIDGHCYAAGDTERPFTLQSLSKPLSTARHWPIAVATWCWPGSASNRRATRSIRSASRPSPAGR